MFSLLPLSPLLRKDELCTPCSPRPPASLTTSSVRRLNPQGQSTLLSYMKLLDIPLGLIINFHALKLAEGVSRLILPGADLG